MFKTTLIILGISVLLCFPGAGEQGVAVAALEANAVTALLSGNDFVSDEEMDRFLGAKEYVFKREWKKASDRLGVYLETYPSGRFVDEALYWLAQSLNKLATDENEKDKIITLKEAAVEKLDALLEHHSRSLWRDDAQTLKIEISGQLALLGLEKHRQYINVIVNTRGQTFHEWKLAAVDALIELAPEAAVTALEDIVNTEEDPSIREKCVYLLARHFPQESLAILPRVEANDPDPSVREEASAWLKKARMRLIPVQLNYYGFAAVLEDRREATRIPEGKINTYDLPKIKSTDKKKVEKEVKRFFHDKFSEFLFVTNSYAAGESFMFNTSHNIKGFNVMVLADGFVKEYDRIQGTVRFRDVDEGTEYKLQYTVDNDEEKLLAVRKGDQVALFVLQFQSHEETEAEKAEADEPIYSTEFSNVVGCRVLSSRQSFSMEEMSMKSAVVDFGRAKAEIPGKHGKWVLIGDILLHTEQRVFVGRKAELFDMTGKRVAQAAQITVPVDNPVDFEVAGESRK